MEVEDDKARVTLLRQLRDHEIILRKLEEFKEASFVQLTDFHGRRKEEGKSL
jgi:hypothetical protein